MSNKKKRLPKIEGHELLKASEEEESVTKIVKRKGRFWDDESQRVKAFQFAKSKNLNYNDMNVKKALREMYRLREGRVYGQNATGIKSHRKRPVLTLKEMEEEASKRDVPLADIILEQGDVLVKEKKAKVIEPNITEFMNVFTKMDETRAKSLLNVLAPQVGDVVLKQLSPEEKTALNSAEAKPPPTGFVSDLDIPSWLLKYTPSLFGEKRDHKGKLIRQPSFYKSQLRILEHIQAYPWAKIEIFRSAGKTQVVDGLLCYYIANNPNERLFIMSEELSKAEKRLRHVRNLLTRDVIVNDYGYLINDTVRGTTKGEDSASSFVCYRSVDAIEPTLQAITASDARSLGNHYTGGVLDDPWSSKLQNQQNAKKKWFDWWDEFTGSLENCGFLYCICTRKGVDDLYVDFDERGTFASVVQPLVKWADWSKCKLLKNDMNQYIGAEWELNDDGTLPYELYDDCKGKYSMTEWFLPTPEERRQGKHPIYCIPIIKMTRPLYFEMEYQQNPYIPEGDMFKWEHANLYGTGETNDVIITQFLRQFLTIRKIMIMDMAFGQSQDSDLNVLLVMGLYRGRFFIIDGVSGHWSGDERIKVIERMERKYPGTPIYIEDDFAQIAWVNSIKKALPHLKIRNFTSRGKGKKYSQFFLGENKAAKKGKILDALEVPWSDGRFYFNNGLRILNDMSLQIRQFPKCGAFDYIDAMAMGVIILSQFLGGVMIATNKIHLN